MPIDKEITIRLIFILAAFGSLTFCGRKGWLRSNETAIVGGAVIFASSGLLLPFVVHTVRERFPNVTTALWVSVGLIFPLILAMVVSLAYLVKRIKKSEK